MLLSWGNPRLPSAVHVAPSAAAFIRSLGLEVRTGVHSGESEVMGTKIGSAFRLREFKATCVELGIKRSFTRPYRPQTDGKAERFIQSALRE